MSAAEMAQYSEALGTARRDLELATQERDSLQRQVDSLRGVIVALSNVLGQPHGLPDASGRPKGKKR